MSAALLCLPAGCAEPVVVRDDGGAGVRFNRPAAYVLVKPTGDWEITYLPDPTQQYVLRCEGWLGSCDLKPALDNGWNLTGIDLSVDKTAPLVALLAAAASARELVGGALHPNAPATLAPGLYRFDLEHQKLIGPVTVKGSPP